MNQLVKPKGKIGILDVALLKYNKMKGCYQLNLDKLVENSGLKILKHEPISYAESSINYYNIKSEIKILFK